MQIGLKQGRQSQGYYQGDSRPVQAFHHVAEQTEQRSTDHVGHQAPKLQGTQDCAGQDNRDQPRGPDGTEPGHGVNQSQAQ